MLWMEVEILSMIENSIKLVNFSTSSDQQELKVGVGSLNKVMIGELETKSWQLITKVGGKGGKLGEEQSPVKSQTQ